MTPADPARARRLAQELVLALDPGMNFPAVAVFDCGVLVHASRVKVPGKMKKLDVGERCRQVAELIVLHVLRETKDRQPTTVIGEWPRIYGRGRVEDPNDLPPLSAINCAVATLFGATLHSPLPQDWAVAQKTKVGSAWESSRGRIIRSRLKPHEFDAVVESHDAVDATGIGLWSLGRLGRSYPGAV